MTPVGFPHSDIHGSQPAFGFPWLFVDRYVLLRLPVPRHPPCALLSLTCQHLLAVFSQSCSNHFLWVLIVSHTPCSSMCASYLFAFFREVISYFSGFTFFRFFFIQFSRYHLRRGGFAASVHLCTSLRYFPFASLLRFPSPAAGLYFAYTVPRGQYLRLTSRRLALPAHLVVQCTRNARRQPWWAQVDSNHRPHAYQACALTT